MTDNNGTYMSRYDDNHVYSFNLFEQPIQVPAIQSNTTLQLSAPEGLIINGTVGTNGQVLASQGIDSAPHWITLTGGGSTTLAELVASNPSCGNAGLTQCSGIQSTGEFALIAGTGLSVGNGIGISGQVLTSQGADEPIWTTVSGGSSTLAQLVASNPSCGNAGLTNCTGVSSSTTLALTSPAGLTLVNGVGSAGQVIQSQGTGLAPIWTTINETQTLTSILNTNTSAGNNPITNLSGVSSGSTLAITAPSGISLSSSVGTEGQVITSHGSAPPTWTTIPSQSTLAQLVASNSSCGNRGLTDLPSITSANTLTLTAPTGLSVGGSVGVAGQVLTSNGGSSSATWETPISNATTLAELVSANPSCGDKGLTHCTGISSATSLTLTTPSGLSVSNGVGTSGQVLTSNALGTPSWTTPATFSTTLADLATANPSCGNTTLTNCNGLTSTGTIALTAPTGLSVSNGVGTSGQVLQSQGSALPPIWVSGGGSQTLSQLVASNPSCGNAGLTDCNGLIGNTHVELTSTGSVSITAPTGLFVNGSFGENGQVLTSQNEGQTIHWTTLPSLAQLADQNQSIGNHIITNCNGLSSAGVIGLVAPNGINTNSNFVSTNNITAGNLISTGTVSGTSATFSGLQINGDATDTGTIYINNIRNITGTNGSIIINGAVQGTGIKSTGSAVVDKNLNVGGNITTLSGAVYGNTVYGSIANFNTISITNWGQSGYTSQWTNSGFMFDFPPVYNKAGTTFKNMGDDSGVYSLNYTISQGQFPNPNPMPNNLSVSITNTNNTTTFVLPNPLNNQIVYFSNFSPVSGTNPNAKTGNTCNISSNDNAIYVSYNGIISITPASTAFNLAVGACGTMVGCGTFWSFTVNKKI